VHGPLAANPQAPAGDPKSVAAPAAAKPAQAAAPVKYVGFVASNKYHYPNCKWAAGINHYSHRTFSSVKEARAKGYIPCPTCNPPSHD
jgi:micrococcal nuclease